MLNKVIVKDKKTNEEKKSLLLNGEVRENFGVIDVYTSKYDATAVMLYLEGLTLDFDIRIIGSVAYITFPLSQPYYELEFSILDDN